MNDAMSFTIMSENVLDEPYASQYYNVYQKGALIGMCIDLLMREESNGNRGILSLMKELSTKYGKNKPFEDDNLIAEITAMTYPSVGEFLQTHVVGDLPINYNEFFAKVGLEMGESKVETNLVQNDGALIFGANQENGTIYFNNLVTQNSFWNDNGVQANDVIKSVDGEEVTMMTANTVFQKVFMWQPGKEINVVLDRGGEEVVIETTVETSYTIGKSLVDNPNATETQKALRKAWLKG
jgi:predicted metalloprotease with PDZ domain